MTDREAGDPGEGREVRVGSGVDAERFAALAEAHRRAGRHAEAERVAREGLECKPGSLEGRVVLSLILLDRNRIAEARIELERLAAEALGAGEPAPPIDLDGELTDQELESAFERAETDPDQLIDADGIAQQAMRDADRALSEELAFEPDAAFATQTVADLLERQGDSARASRIRSALEDGTPGAPETEGGGRSGSRQRAIEMLEHWLDNLRRGVR